MISIRVFQKSNTDLRCLLLRLWSQGAWIGRTWIDLGERGDFDAGLISLNYCLIIRIFFFRLDVTFISQTPSCIKFQVKYRVFYNKCSLVTVWGNEYSVTWKFSQSLSKGSQNMGSRKTQPLELTDCLHLGLLYYNLVILFTEDHFGLDSIFHF